MSSIFARAASRPGQHPITSVVGIVDQLPGAVTRISSPTGSEGIAYLLAPVSSHGTEAVGQPNEESTSLLRFWLRKGRVHDFRPASGMVPFAKGSGSVSVPLANTIFINGRRTTLNETVWKKNSDALVPDLSSPIGVLNIPLQRRVDHGLRRGIPLMEITPERVVRSAMGNILKEVDIDGNEAVPASKELEAAVMRSPFPAHPDGTRPRVFAQIKPPWLSTFESAPSTAAIFAGVGLYHVTGGGGGWGQKQGLLSLDPIRTYSPTSDGQLAQAPHITSDDAVGNVFRRDADLVKPGDTVQFFREITESDEHDVRAEDSLQGLNWGSQDETQRVLIGVVPTEADGSNSTNDFAANETSSAIHLPNKFGVLSERGFALEFTGEKFRRDANGASSMEGEPNTPESIHSQSKVEVSNAWLGAELQLTWKARLQKRARMAEFEGRKIVIDTAVPTMDSPLPATEGVGLEEQGQATPAQRDLVRKAPKQVKGTTSQQNLVRKVKVQDKAAPAQRDLVRKGKQQDEATPLQPDLVPKGQHKTIIQKHEVEEIVRKTKVDTYYRFRKI